MPKPKFSTLCVCVEGGKKERGACMDMEHGGIDNVCIPNKQS